MYHKLLWRKLGSTLAIGKRVARIVGDVTSPVGIWPCLQLVWMLRHDMSFINDRKIMILDFVLKFWLEQKKLVLTSTFFTNLILKHWDRVKKKAEHVSPMCSCRGSVWPRLPCCHEFRLWWLVYNFQFGHLMSPSKRRYRVGSFITCEVRSTGCCEPPDSSTPPSARLSCWMGTIVIR
jgi:hypothetical protein